jgi:hypothetical protein
MSFGGFGGFGEEESQEVSTAIGKTPTVCFIFMQGFSIYREALLEGTPQGVTREFEMSQ